MFKRKPKLRSLWPAFAFTAIVLLGIVLRVQGIEGRDFWYDETFTGVTLNQSWSEMHAVIIADVHPPFYYWLLKGWSLVGGTGPISLRLFSVLFGVATIILAFIAMRQWFSKSWVPALLGALVIAINPFLVIYSQEARMYTLLGALLLAAAIFFWRGRSANRQIPRVIYSVIGAAILLTHYLGAIFLLAFFLYDLWEQYQAGTKLKHWKKQARWFLSGYGLPLIAGLAWLPFFLKQSQAHPSLGWVPDAPLHLIGLSLHKFLFGSPVGVQGVPPALSYRVEWLTVETVSLFLILGTCVLITWISAKRLWNQQLAFLAFLSAFPLALTWILQFVEVQLYVERFLSGTAIFFLLFLVSALSVIHRDLLTGMVIAYAWLVILIQPWSYQSFYPQIAETLNAADGRPMIVSTDPFQFVTLRYYLGEDLLDRLRIYNLSPDHRDLSTWVLIDENVHEIKRIPDGNAVIITDKPEQFSGYASQEIGNLHLLTKSGL